MIQFDFAFVLFDFSPQTAPERKNPPPPFSFPALGDFVCSSLDLHPVLESEADLVFTVHRGVIHKAVPVILIELRERAVPPFIFFLVLCLIEGDAGVLEHALRAE